MTEPAESLNNFHDINNGYRVDMTAVNNLTQMLTYDMQGNILTLSRKGPIASQLYGVIDNITATYQGNQIATLRDDAANVLLESSLDMPHGEWSGSDFEYDRNGNQTRDLSRDVADIVYNELNLPERVEMDGGGSIEYLYSAAGTKLAEIVRDEDDQIINRRDYAGMFEYEADSIIRFSLASGYVTVADTTYHLYIPDYQGNIVAVYNTSTGQQEHFKDYYPYGIPHAEMPKSWSILPGLNPGLGSGLGPIIITPTDPETSTPSTNRRWYGAKELTTDHGLNIYNFEARIFSPIFPRFTTIDPLADSLNIVSTYNYCDSDPINLIDPTGLGWIEDKETHVITWDENVTSEENTPQGYNFIGNSNGSILAHYGIPYTKHYKNVNGWGVGLWGDVFMGRFNGAFAKIRIGYLVDPYVEKINNKQTFIGIKFECSCYLTPFWAIEDFKLDYKGGFTITFSNMIYNIILKNPPPGMDILKSPESIFKCGEVLIPANDLYSKGVIKLSSITARLGALNNNFIYVHPLELNFFQL